MKHDNLREYVTLRDAILHEKTEIEQRLREINQVLGQMGATYRQDSPPGSRAVKGNRSRNSISLREAVIEVVKTGPLPKQEILNAVENLGYKFSTPDPINSLGVILYGKNPKFSNDGGRFGLPVGYVPQAPKQRGRPARAAGKNEKGSARRPMSPEAKERIAAAARARWAKWRADGNK